MFLSACLLTCENIFIRECSVYKAIYIGPGYTVKKQFKFYFLVIEKDIHKIEIHFFVNGVGKSIINV